MGEHVLSCSFGKDSLATVCIARDHGEPLEELVYCEVMFDKETSGEVPEHRDFIYEKAIPKIESWGIKVSVLRPQKTYVDAFTQTIRKGNNAGKICSFPLCGRCMIQRDCKARPLNRWKREHLGRDTVQYLGIAADEKKRLARLDGVKLVSLLDKYGIDEADTPRICKAHGLLSPVYEFSDRGGCFFCPNAKERELRHLYDHHKPLWEKMLKLQALPGKVTERFNRELTFAEIDYNFRMDDAQLDLFSA